MPEALDPISPLWRPLQCGSAPGTLPSESLAAAARRLPPLTTLLVACRMELSWLHAVVAFNAAVCLVHAILDLRQQRVRGALPFHLLCPPLPPARCHRPVGPAPCPPAAGAAAAQAAPRGGAPVH